MKGYTDIHVYFTSVSPQSPSHSPMFYTSVLNTTTDPTPPPEKGLPLTLHPYISLGPRLLIMTLIIKKNPLQVGSVGWQKSKWSLLELYLDYCYVETGISTNALKNSRKSRLLSCGLFLVIFSRCFRITLNEKSTFLFTWFLFKMWRHWVCTKKF